ncbi:DUF2273 domain-containing protein [Granulimonas faecalis]|uniref:DUF2273 domain-containing protein n=1 Tax=Granulimonas faecalis TaxID=2894155 RepID=UPI003515FCEE
MADKNAAPRVTVEVDGVDVDVRDAPTSDQRASGAEARRRAAAARDAAATWVDGAFPGHRNAVLFGVLGFVCALLIFWIGFFQALLVAVFVVCGVAFGQWLDGDPRIVNGVKRLLGPGNDPR